MPENMMQSENELQQFKEAVCINAKRIYDSCSDKSCLSDLQVHFTGLAQAKIDAACSVKCKSVSVMNVMTEVEAVPFNTGFYSVDMTYHFLVTVEVSAGGISMPQRVDGVACYNKKVILYGSEGKTKMFCSDQQMPVSRCADVFPQACVQVASPIVLASKLCDSADLAKEPYIEIPQCIKEQFEGNFENADGAKTVLVSVGLFSIVHLQRNVQVMVPAYEFKVPDKECIFTTDDPCEIFSKIKFPTGEFFPPRLQELPEE
jgi:hypothetical protein